MIHQTLFLEFLIQLVGFIENLLVNRREMKRRIGAESTHGRKEQKSSKKRGLAQYSSPRSAKLEIQRLKIKDTGLAYSDARRVDEDNVTILRCES